MNRLLSPMERWYWICDQISPLNVIGRVHIAGACTSDDLERAAAQLVQEHPLLRVAITADGRFVAAHEPRIPIRTVRAGSWEREVNDVELVSSVDWRSGPLARITDVVRAPGCADESHDLILTVSHVIADGTTALELLRRLVELAAGARSLHAQEPLPSPEALLPKRVNGLPRALHLAAWAIVDQIATAIARPRRLQPGTSVAPDHRRTRLIHRSLDSEQLGLLMSKCRREGVTVHSALAAAMAFAVAEEDARRVTIGSPVDFRSELVPPVAPTDAGAYVATVPTYVKVGTDLWTAARGVYRNLHRSKRFRHHLALVAMLRLISPKSVGKSARAVAMVDRMGPGNVCLSNIGRHDFPDRAGRWQLSGAQFIAGISVSGYLVATVNTSHSELHWNFTYIEDAITGERAGRIADRAMRTLLSNLRHTGTPIATGTRG